MGGLKRGTPLRRISHGRSLVAAAVVVIVGLIAVSSYWTYYASSPGVTETAANVQMQNLYVDSEKRADLTFSDGTRVTLNAASSLRFPSEFRGTERQVYLDGEAFFEVAPNERQPFIVQTSSARIEVLGTKFNVQAWEEDQSLGVIVQEGRVLVESADSTSSSKSVVLNTHQRAILEKGASEFLIDTIDNEQFLYWLNGGLYFYNTPFPSVISRLERRYGVKIEIIDQQLSEYKYSGAFQKVDLQEALEVISVSLDVLFEKSNNHISVRTKK
jgi:ferric-dicitrate binding protein FerR (iron transport regulator)